MMGLTRKSKSILPEDKEEGCGISYIYILPPTHPFHSACVWHDQQYQAEPHEFPRKFVDQHFYQLCKDAAGDSKKLKALAKLFYVIVRVFGGLFW